MILSPKYLKRDNLAEQPLLRYFSSPLFKLYIFNFLYYKKTSIVYYIFTIDPKQ